MNEMSFLAITGAIFAGAMAVVVALRERRSVAYWSFITGMVLLATECIFSSLSAEAILPVRMIHWQQWRLISLSFLPGLWLLFSLSYSLVNAQELLRKWRLVIAIAVLVPTGVATLFHDGLIIGIEQSVSGDYRVLRLGPAGLALNLLFLVSVLLVLMNLERTFRASVGTTRWRIKFMILGLGVLFAVRAYTCVQAQLFRSVDIPLVTLNSGALVVACLMILRALFRAGNFGVNVYLSQSALHHSLTVLIAGIYLVIVGVFAKMVAFLGGDAAFTVKAFFVLVLLVLLTILLVSDRVRLYTKRFVSRHFQRPLYDYRAIWRNFSDATAACVEQAGLCRAAVKLIADMFQVLSVTIWLVDGKQETIAFAASTSLSEVTGEELKPHGSEAAELIHALRQLTEPIDIESSKERWAVALRRCQPDEFHKGGTRVCVPIIGGGELLGLVTLGDRVSGVAFSPQDYDLLKCVGGQVAASLLNVQLSQKLLQAKELEAFQTMSAFFVHDLKNTASTLSLMLQNLPVHFDDPAFREDALRGISKTVTHINQLIGRLSLLRHDLAIHPVECDLNDVVTKGLAEWEKVCKAELVKELRPLPKVVLDQDQMLKVVTNLVLNAADAVSEAGQIRIETSQRNGWTILAVSDNGCGMSAEFLNRSLFRPFQTTKKKGLGIGMFQSKQIVEAHGGRIEVDSEIGKGTTFRILLPLQVKN